MISKLSKFATKTQIMDRRQVLIAAAAAVSSLAGCSQTSEGDSGQGPTENAPPSTTARPEPTTSQPIAETPKEAVRSYLTAIFSGDVQGANARIHPDGDVSEYTEGAAERNEEINLTIQALEITEESENTATVTAVVTLENPEADEAVTRSQIYSLQTDNGTWKIYTGEDDKAA
jgi:hypothetical protein